MTEKPLPLLEEYGPIHRLYQDECTAILTLTRRHGERIVDSAAFIFLKIAHAWYRIYVDHQSIHCKYDAPTSPIYRLSENGYTYQQTDLSPLILTGAVRIIDIYLLQGFNYTKCVFNFTHSRSLELRYYQDSGRTLLSMI